MYHKAEPEVIIPPGETDADVLSLNISLIEELLKQKKYKESPYVHPKQYPDAYTIKKSDVLDDENQEGFFTNIDLEPDTILGFYSESLESLESLKKLHGLPTEAFNLLDCPYISNKHSNIVGLPGIEDLCAARKKLILPVHYANHCNRKIVPSITCPTDMLPGKVYIYNLPDNKRAESLYCSFLTKDGIKKTQKLNKKLSSKCLSALKKIVQHAKGLESKAQTALFNLAKENGFPSSLCPEVDLVDEIKESDIKPNKLYLCLEPNSQGIENLVYAFRNKEDVIVKREVQDGELTAKELQAMYNLTA